MRFADTGHLCLATLHANSTNHALETIINFFPEERREQLLMDLSMNLRGMISQRLLQRENGKGRAVVVEVMNGSPAAKAGLKPGLLITEANGKPVLHPNELNDAVRNSGGRLKLTVVEPNSGRSASLNLDLR